MNQKISPLDPRVVIHGRTVRQIPLPLFWTASGVELETNARMLAFVLDASFTTREPWVRRWTARLYCASRSAADKIP